MNKKLLTALPVFNEVSTVETVLDLVLQHSSEVLVIDDGSTDGTAEILAKRDDVIVVPHAQNRGYGAALVTAFNYASANGYETLVTIDCDGQHEPQRIQEMVRALLDSDADIASGSRYLKTFDANSQPPAQRRWINQQITREVNELLDLELTDAFCGFKAYRVSELKKLDLQETGYAMPLELWVQAFCAKLKIVEVAVPLIYLDEKRSFGGELDDAVTRLNYYNQVLQSSFDRLPKSCEEPSSRERAG